MKRVLAAIILTTGVVAANAQTVIDNFDEANHYALPFDPAFGANGAYITSPTVFTIQALGGSGYHHGFHHHHDAFIEDSGGGVLHAEGHHGSAGEVDLSYLNPGYAGTDLTGTGSVIVDVLQATRPVNVAWGFFTGSGFDESSASAVFSGPGVYTLNLSDLGGATPDLTDVRDLFFEMDVPHGGQLTLGSVSLGQAVATPEPAPFVGMGLGVGLLALRRRKKA